MSTSELSAVPPTDVFVAATSFGTFRVDRRDAVEFPAGVPGFEQCKRFVVLGSDDIAPLRCLHSVDGPPASFLVVDPRELLPQYRAVLSQTDLFRIGASDATALVWLAVVGFDGGGAPYANLRAPIVINPERMLGYQVMPHNSLYPLRHPLTSE